MEMDQVWVSGWFEWNRASDGFYDCNPSFVDPTRRTLREILESAAVVTDSAGHLIRLDEQQQVCIGEKWQPPPAPATTLDLWNYECTCAPALGVPPCPGCTASGNSELLHATQEDMGGLL